MDDAWNFPNPLDLLSHCKGLNSLSLKGLPLQSYPIDKELHLVHTLSTMTLTETSLGWMSGRTFTSLKECRIMQPDQEECSKLLPIHLPVCTFWSARRAHLVYCPNSGPHLYVEELTNGERIERILYNNVTYLKDDEGMNREGFPTHRPFSRSNVHGDYVTSRRNVGEAITCNQST